MASSNDVDGLRTLVQRFVRGFGLLGESQTPCGQPLHTSHAHALMILLGAGDAGLHQAALARLLGINRSNACRLMRQLATKGHIVETGDDDDARLKRIRLSAKGMRVASAVEDSSRRRFAELLRDIPPNSRRSVFLGLEALSRALEQSVREEAA